MADQGKWFKLWCTSLRDDALEDLSLEDWARWVRLGAHIKENGRDGKIRFSYPARNLVNLFRVPNFKDAIDVIRRFPNVLLGERSSTVTPVTNATVTYEIEYQNWFKYQGDFSNDRVRKFRDKKRHAVTAQEEKRSRREEKRIITPALVDVVAFAKDQNLPLDCEKFFNHFESKGWFSGRTKIKDWKASARNAAKDWAHKDNEQAGVFPQWMKTK